MNGRERDLMEAGDVEVMLRYAGLPVAVTGGEPQHARAGGQEVLPRLKESASVAD